MEKNKESIWKDIIKEAFQTILGIVVVVGFFMLLNSLIHKSIPVENRDLLTTVIGALIGSFITVVTFHFGSSKGSRSKDKQITKKLS